MKYRLNFSDDSQALTDLNTSTNIMLLLNESNPTDVPGFGNKTFINSISDLDFIYYIFNVLGIIITLATIVGNVLVIIAVVSQKKLRKVGNVFIISLALTDCLVGIIVSPLAITYDIRGMWILGKTMCDIWVSMDVICCTASILNLCAISYDRCHAIIEPIQYSRRRTYSRAWLIVALLWLYSAGIALPPFLGWGNEPDRIYHTDCHVSRDSGYTLFSTIGAFYLPLCFMTYFYVKIYRATCVKKTPWVQCFGSNRFDGHQWSDSLIQGDGKEKSCCNCLNIHLMGRFERPGIAAQASIDTSETGVANTDRKCDISDVPDAEIRLENIEPEILAIYQIRQRSRRNCSTVTESSFGSTFMSSSTDSSNTATTSFSESSDRSYSISTECSGRSFSASMESGRRVSSSADTGRRYSVLRSHRLSSARHSSLKAEVIHELVAAQGGQLTEQTDLPIEIQRKSPIKRSDTDDANDEESDETVPRRRQKKLKSSTFRHRNSRKRRRIALSQEKRAAKTLGIVMGCFILCWSPFFIVTILRPFCTQCYFHPLLEKAVSWLGYFNSACNPIIYSFFNKDFRLAFKKISFSRSPNAVHL